MPRRLKVYRTAIGFHDAYVAAPSMKAALAAWGTDKDLFARKAAELVEDPALAAEPLAHPGQVIRRLRGSEAEHVKALGTMPRPRPTRPVVAEEKASAPKPSPAKKRAPKPSNEFVVQARAALRATQVRSQKRRDELDAREKELAQERHRAERELTDETHRREEAVRRAEEKYGAELAEWREP